MDNETRIKNLETRLDLLNNSNSIPRNVETAFRQRIFGNGLIRGNGLTWGKVALSGAVTSSVTITDSKIKLLPVASVISVIPDVQYLPNPAGYYVSALSNGSITVSSTVSFDTANLYYFLIY